MSFALVQMRKTLAAVSVWEAAAVLFAITP